MFSHRKIVSVGIAAAMLLSLPVSAFAFPPFTVPGANPPQVNAQGTGGASAAIWSQLQLGGGFRTGVVAARGRLWYHNFLQQHCPANYSIIAANGVAVPERMWHNQNGDASIVFTEILPAPTGVLNQANPSQLVLHREVLQDEIQITRMSFRVLNGIAYWGADINRRPSRLFTSNAWRSTREAQGEGPWLAVDGATVPRSQVEQDFIPVCRRNAGVAGDAGVCGNGIIDPSLGEMCEDGNSVSFDGCSETCQTETMSCESSAYSMSTVAFCGDETMGPGEECDDGNGANGDGCSDSCLIEMSPVVAVCGDGIAQVWNGEQCDGGSGCSSACLFDDPLPAPVSMCSALCGDAVCDAGETNMSCPMDCEASSASFSSMPASSVSSAS
ncbi:DUF4215 domain-containing protein [Candidatus Peregrinibacteria bacterium]|nr:DUF4215 domain-containing protein [Candidatus Peregrinibacteria bacterium]